MGLVDETTHLAVDLERDLEVKLFERTTKGLRLTGAGNVVGYPRATAHAEAIPPCDFGIVATKAMHTEAAIAATAHAFADGCVATVQNGLGNEETLTPDEVYSLTAYLLFLNKVIPEDMVLDRDTLPKIKMPIGEEYGKPHEFKVNSPRLSGYPY